MLYVGAFGLLLGVLHGRHANLLTIAVSAALAAVWVGFVDSAVSRSMTHALLAGLCSAWSLQLGVVGGFVFDRLVLRPDRG